MLEKQTFHHIFRLFADILEYPAPGLLDKVKECHALLSPGIPIAAAGLELFCGFVERTSQGKIEEIYTSAFDLQGVCYPYAGYHLFGESYKRGVFMVRLKEHFLAHGFSVGNELPDHISILLRFLAILQDEELSGVLIKECLIPSLRKMKESFVENNNPYGKVIESLLLMFERSDFSSHGLVLK